MLLVVWKVNGRSLTSTPCEANTIGGIDLKIGRINYLWGSDEAGEVSNFQPFRGRLGDRVKYTLFGALKKNLPTFFSTRSGRTARQTAAPRVLKHVFSCREVPFGGLLDTLPFWVI